MIWDARPLRRRLLGRRAVDIVHDQPHRPRIAAVGFRGTSGDSCGNGNRGDSGRDFHRGGWTMPKYTNADMVEFMQRVRAAEGKVGNVAVGAFQSKVSQFEQFSSPLKFLVEVLENNNGSTVTVDSEMKKLTDSVK